MRKSVDMLTGSLTDKILLFAIPLACTGILQQLFNAADIMIVGRFSGKQAMAAVGSNAPIIGLLINLFVGMSVGANVVSARFIGQKKLTEIKMTVGTAVTVSIIGGLFLAVVGQFIAEPVLAEMSLPNDVLPMAVSYFRIYMAGMPAMLLYNFESAIFRSNGDTKIPLICLIAAGLLNVILNLVFVIGLHSGAAGVATATVISNIFSAAVMFVLLICSESIISIERKFLKPNGAVLLTMMRIGVPAGIQAMLFSLSNIIIQSAINFLGTDIIAASVAAFNVEIFSYFVVNSFGQACTTFIGQNHGAGQISRCRKAVRSAFGLDIICTVVMSLLIIVFSRTILSLFNDEPAVVHYGRMRIMFITPFQIFNVIMEIFSGAMRGYGQSFVPAVIVLFGVCGVRIGWLLTIFAAHHDFGTLLVCYPLSWAVTAAILVCCYFIYVRKVNLLSK